MSVLLTSDPHFGHELVAGTRGFTNTEEHDAAVLASYEQMLAKGDQLWILGDLSSGSRRKEERALALLDDLAGHMQVSLHLIEGNHDSCSSVHRDGYKRIARFYGVFDSVQSFARRRGPERVPVLLSHYPISGDHTDEERYEYARLRDTGAWVLHGHTHSEKTRSVPRGIHVGWDAWHRPVRWDEVLEIIASDAA